MEENNELTKKINNDPHTLHTYTSDMADAIRANEVSVIKIALAEQKRKERETIYRQVEGTPMQKFWWIIGGVIFVVLGIFFVYFVFQKKTETNAPLQVDIRNQAIIAYDNSVMIPITDNTNEEDIAKTIATVLANKQTPGTISNIFFTKDTPAGKVALSRDELLGIIKLSASASLIRSFGDKYMIGTYQGSDTTVGPALFMIFETKDYSQTFAGMLDWEKTMLNDLYSLFGTDVSGDRAVLFEKPFKDIIIDNKDARILYDKDGKDVLYYSFINKDGFIITTSQDAIKEVYRRIITAQAKPI